MENALRGRVDLEGATAKFGGLNMTPGGAALDRPHHHCRLRHELARGAGGRIPDRGTRAHARSRSSSPRILLPQLRRWSATRCCWSSRNPARPPTRWPRLREAKRRGHRALAIVNVVGSTIARESDGGIYLHAGPEIGVASTKAFVSTLTILALLAVHLGRMRMLSAQPGAGNSATRWKPRRNRSSRSWRRTTRSKQIALKYAEGRRLLFPRPRLHVPDRARRRAEAQGNLLHPRRGLPGRRDEARADRAD